jgi:hypothetical protein
MHRNVLGDHDDERDLGLDCFLDGARGLMGCDVNTCGIWPQDFHGLARVSSTARSRTPRGPSDLSNTGEDWKPEMLALAAGRYATHDVSPPFQGLLGICRCLSALYWSISMR